MTTCLYSLCEATYNPASILILSRKVWNESGTMPNTDNLGIGTKRNMAKITLAIESPEALETFKHGKVEADGNRHGGKVEMVGALFSVLQFAQSAGDISSTMVRLKAGWGELSPLLEDAFHVADDVIHRCNTKTNPIVKDLRKQDPVKWGEYMAQTKTIASDVFSRVNAFLDTLSLETFVNLPKATRGPNAKAGPATLTVGDATYDAQSIFSEPTFIFALADKSKLDAFYAENGASDNFKAQVWKHLVDVATFKRVKAPRKTLAELETILASGKDSKGNDLTDNAKATLTTRIEKARAKESAK